LTSSRNHQGIGAPLRRVEDRRLLLGRGRFVADIAAPDALYCVFVRSPHPHARIRGIDASAAMALPGVVAVLTGSDMAADGVKPMRPLWIIQSRDGSPMAEPRRFALARGIVRHVGEPIAAVIAQTCEQATDGAERVALESPDHAVSASRRVRGSSSHQSVRYVSQNQVPMTGVRMTIDPPGRWLPRRARRAAHRHHRCCQSPVVRFLCTNLELHGDHPMGFRARR
jgi:xanthine dehydrogenase molybdopterin-binding subunit B